MMLLPGYRQYNPSQRLVNRDGVISRFGVLGEMHYRYFFRNQSLGVFGVRCLVSAFHQECRDGL